MRTIATICMLLTGCSGITVEPVEPSRSALPPFLSTMPVMFIDGSTTTGDYVKIQAATIGNEGSTP